MQICLNFTIWIFVFISSMAMHVLFVSLGNSTITFSFTSRNVEAHLQQGILVIV